MGSQLGPSLANTFLAYHEEKCPLEYWPLYYRQYIDDIFILFQIIWSLKIEIFLDVNFICEQHKLTTDAYIKNQLLVIYAPILMTFYIIATKLVWFTH